MTDRDDRIPTDAPAEALALLYERATRRLRFMIREGLLRGNLASVAYRQDQLVLAEAILRRLKREQLPLVPRVVARAYARGLVMVDKLTGMEASFGGIHERAVAVAAHALADTLDESLATVGRQQRDFWRQNALKAVGQGLIEGETRKAVSAVLMRDLQQEGVTAFVDRAGKRWRLDVYTRMVARTTSREAVTLATANRLLEGGRPDIQISSHDTKTPLCKRYEGRRFSLVRNGRYPFADRLPPYHPNCMHVAHPATSTFEEAERALASAATYEDLERALLLRARMAA